MSATDFTAAGFKPVLSAILADYQELAAAYLFGSAARDELRPDSDIDVGLVFRKKGDRARDHHRMIGDLASRLEQVVAPRRVDIVVLEEQGPIFCHRVLTEGRLILEHDRDRRIDFESDTFIRALDFRPTYEIAACGHVKGFRAWLQEQLP